MAGQLTETQGNINQKLSRRRTEQRQLILGIIRQADRHLDTDEIYQQARKKLPGISLSTVYRSLQMSKSLELIEEHQFYGMRCYYETTPRSKHHHLVCLACGRIFEFTCPSTEKFKLKISKKEGFRITDAEVRLVGYCPECQRRLSNNMTDTKKQVAEGR